MIWTIPKQQPEPKVIPRLIIIREPPLGEAEIDKAFAGNSGAQWYRALVQIIDDTRQANIWAASKAASEGNTHAMAGAVNAYEAFSALLIELDKKVNATSPSE